MIKEDYSYDSTIDNTIYDVSKDFITEISLEELKRMRNRKYKYITNTLDTDVYVKPFRLERKGY